MRTKELTSSLSEARSLEDTSLLQVGWRAYPHQMVLRLVPAGDRSGVRTAGLPDRRRGQPCSEPRLQQPAAGSRSLRSQGTPGSYRRELPGLAAYEPCCQSRQAACRRPDTGRHQNQPREDLASAGLRRRHQTVAVPAEDLAVGKGVRTISADMVGLPPARTRSQSPTVGLDEPLFAVAALMVGMAGSPALAMPTCPGPRGIDDRLRERHGEPPGS